MKKEFLPYLLPIISIIVLFGIVAINPSITGFAVKNVMDKVSGNVVVFTDSNVVLPLDSMVSIGLDNRTITLSLKQFIEKNGSWYEIKSGYYPEIGYYGEGFSGNHNYALSLESLGLGIVDNKEAHDLNIRIVYKDKIITQNSQKISK